MNRVTSILQILSIITIFQVILLESFSPLLAQTILPESENSYDFEFLLFENGETTGYVNSLIQDSTGLLWIGSKDGLLIYDGKEMQFINDFTGKIKIQIKGEFRITKINDEVILLTNNKHLHWINIRTREILQQVDLEENYEGYEIFGTSLFQERVWIVIMDFANNCFLLKFDKKGNSTKVDQFQNNSFANITCNDNFLVVSINNGVNYYNSAGIKVKTVLLEDPNKLLVPYSLQFDENNTLWLKGDCEHELNIFRYQGYDFESPMDCSIYFLEQGKDSLQKIQVNNEVLKGTFFLKKETSNLWIGGENLSLKKLNVELNTIENYSNSLIQEYNKLDKTPAYSQITELYELDKGIVFLCTTSGLIKGTPRSSTNYNTYMRSDPRFCESICSIHDLTEDPSGNIWFCNNNELYKLDPKNESISLMAEKSYTEELGTAYSISNYGDILYWNDLEVNTVTDKVNPIFALPSIFQVCNIIDTNNKLWIQKRGEDEEPLILSYLDLETKELIDIDTNSSFLKSGQVNQFLSIPNSEKMWMATSSGGIFILDSNGKVLKQIAEIEIAEIGAVTNTVYSLLLDRDSHIWLGTDIGLFKFNQEGEQLESYFDFEVDHLRRSNLRSFYSILETEQNNLLLGSNVGLIKFNTSTHQFYSLKGLDKLSKEDFNRIAAYRSKAGKYYFGCVNGFFEFKLDQIDPFFHIQNNRRPIFIQADIANTKTGTRLIYKDEIDEKGIQLDHNDTYLEMKYTLPDFYIAEEILYSYSLEGFDYNWSKPDHGNSLRFNKLPAGEYQLKLRAGYEQDAMDLYSQAISINVKRAWFNTLWFRSLIFFLLLGGSFSFFRMRFLNKEKERRRIDSLRRDISSDLHDDVGSVLSGLSMQAQVLEYSSEEKDKLKFQELSDMSAKAIEMMRDTVWAIDSRQDQYNNLMDKMGEYAQKSLMNSHWDYTISLKGIDGLGKILPNVRKEIYLIFKEAISNAIKHSNGNLISIILEKKKGKLGMRIHDNGSVKVNSKSAGQGFSNMNLRAKRLNGNLIILKENGFAVELKIPLE